MLTRVRFRKWRWLSHSVSLLRTCANGAICMWSVYILCYLTSQKVPIEEVLKKDVQLLKQKLDGLRVFKNEEMEEVIIAIFSHTHNQCANCVVILVWLY